MFGLAIDAEVITAITKNDVDYINVHYNPKLADYLLSHMKCLPLWSNIKRDDFAYSRVSAISASVESDFNNVKNRILKSDMLTTRAEVIVEKHINYLNGKMKIINCILHYPRSKSATKRPQL